VSDGNANLGFARAGDKPYAKGFGNRFRNFCRQSNLFALDPVARNATYVRTVTEF
jgi:hypothetical protein